MGPASIAAGCRTRAARSESIDVDHCLRKSLRGFLRKVVPDAAADEPMLVFARELLGVGFGRWVGCAIRIALERDRGHGDDGRLGKPALEVVILRFAFGQSLPPAVIVDRDVDVIGIVEGGGAALERGVVELPLRRSYPPDEFREVVPVLVVAELAALGGKVELVPPLVLGGWRQRDLAGFLTSDQIAADRDQRLATLRPKRRDDVGGTRANIEGG